MGIKTELDEAKLAERLKVIRNALQCPHCGAPIWDLTDVTIYHCAYCKESFQVTAINEKSKEKLSYAKLKELADLQVSTAILSSYMDVQFNEDRFVPRAGADGYIHEFITENHSRKRLFLLLGDAGFGKTWLVAHWAKLLKSQGFPVFYIRLADGISSFFRMTFDSTRTEALRDIDEAMEGIPVKPLIWIMDGYDEIHDEDDRSILLTELLKNIEKHEMQFMVITSRSYDWEHCRTRKDQNLRITQMLWVKPEVANASLHMQTYSEGELDQAINRYHLPALDSWSRELQALAKYPLWVRLITEWYQNKQVLPNVMVLDVYEAYFRRMRLESEHLRALGAVSASCVRAKSFGENISRNTIPQVDSKVLDALISAGVLFHTEDLFAPKVSLTTPVFGRFGAAFHGSCLFATDDLLYDDFITQVEQLPLLDRDIILDLIHQRGLPCPVDFKHWQPSPGNGTIEVRSLEAILTLQGRSAQDWWVREDNAPHIDGEIPAGKFVGRATFADEPGHPPLQDMPLSTQCGIALFTPPEHLYLFGFFTMNISLKEIRLYYVHRAPEKKIADLDILHWFTGKKIGRTMASIATRELKVTRPNPEKNDWEFAYKEGGKWNVLFSGKLDFPPTRIALFARTWVMPILPVPKWSAKCHFYI